MDIDRNDPDHGFFSGEGVARERVSGEWGRAGVQGKKRDGREVRAVILISNTMYYIIQTAINIHQDIPYCYLVMACTTGALVIY